MGKYIGEVAFSPEDVMEWRPLNGQSVREAMVDTAGEQLQPALKEEGAETWWGHVRFDHEYAQFVVTIWEGYP